MGPLSWLTQLSFIPQTIATAGASGATALTAVVGLGAGALGVGLSDDGSLSGSRDRRRRVPARRSPVDDVIGLPQAAGVTGDGPDSGDDGIEGVTDGGVIGVDDGDPGGDPGGDPVARRRRIPAYRRADRTAAVW